MTATAEASHRLCEFSSEAVTAWAAVATAIFAAATVGIAAWAARIGLRQIMIALQQVRDAREISKITDAQESYRSYLETCVQYPEFATPDYEVIKKDPLKLKAYDWFVAYLLAASEKILESAGHEHEWIVTIKLNIEYHTKLLTDEAQFRDAELACYSPRLRKLIFEATKRRLPKDAEDASKQVAKP